MKRVFLFLAALFATSGSYAYNVNQVSIPGLIYDGGNSTNILGVDTSSAAIVNTEGKKKTYAVTGVAITPAATTTDLAILNGSSTKTIKVTRVTVSGLATTAGTMDVTLMQRSTADSGGTCTTPTIVPEDSNDSAATGVLTTCTANPTTGTAVGGIADQKLDFGVAGAAANIVFDFGNRPSKEPTLRGAAAGLAIYLNGQAVPTGGTISYTIEWTEE